MSKFKKLSLTLALMLFISMLCTSTVNAKKLGNDPDNMTVDSVNVGDTAYLSEKYTHDTHHNFFCVCHWQNYNGGLYKAIAKINIKGNYSTDKNNKEIKNIWNGIIAYDLSLSNGKRGFINGGNPAQYQIYKDMKGWIDKVGVKYNKKLDGFSTGAADSNYDSKTFKEAKEYAKSLDKDALTNKTNKSNIKTSKYEKDGKECIKIGPFKYNFREKLTKIELSDNNGKKITPIAYGRYISKKFKEKELDKIKSGKSFYIIIPMDSGLSSINNIKVYESHTVKSATIVFWRNQFNIKAINYQNIIQFDKSEEQEPVEDSWDIDIPLYGNLKLTKKDFDDNKNISEVTFKVQNEKGEFVKKDSKGNIAYVEEKAATTFKTDSNGEVKIENLKVGKYTIKEIKNPNGTYGGETGDVDTSNIYYNTNVDSKKKTVKNGNITVTVKAGSDDYTTIYIYNKKAYIDLSGYVWEDIAGGKDNTYSTYGENIYAEGDVLLEGIKVRLVNQNGETIKEKTTDSQGHYTFTNIAISQLKNYNIEFEYDGLIYTSVKPLVGNDDSVNSKASEVVEQRKSLNAAFTEITNNGNITDKNHGYSRDANGNVTGTLTYNNDTENWASSYESSTYNTNLKANTKVASYSINDQFKNGNYTTNSNGSIEIQNINLGVLKRQQPQMSISNDIESVRIDINGYSHRYDYAQRNDFIKNNTAFNVGVKFGREYISGYTRAIYPSDIQYSSTDAEDSNKLKVYVTYATTIRNLSSNLLMTANELVNYYDTRYKIVNSWIDDNTNNKITWNETSKYGQSYSDDKYKASYTTGLAGERINAGENKKVYIEFQVSDEAVLGLLNNSTTLDNTLLDNTLEIFSYSTYYGSNAEGCKAGDIYAGIDKASAPGNAKMELDSENKLIKTTYEADTDSAPSLLLEAKGVRTIEGTVFEDDTNEQLQSGKERKGDGVYDASKENTVAGVKVELIKASNGQIAKVYPPKDITKNGQDVKDADKGVDAMAYTHDDNGNLGQNNGLTGKDGYYIIKGIEPDEYLVKYTYANGTTKLFDTNHNEVTNKKVTVQNYKSTIITSDIIKEAFETSGKADSWYKTEVEKRYSDARDDYKQRQDIDKEITNIDSSTGEKFQNDSINADTPILDLGVEYETIYTASTGDYYEYKVSDIDFGIVERPRQSATLDKVINNIKVTLPNGQVLVDGNPQNNLDYVTVTGDTVYITMDSELLQGSQIEIKYALTLINTSELDYSNENYYYYGSDTSNPVKLTSATLIDYVDSEMTLKAGQEDKWSVLDLAKYGLELSEDEKTTLLNQYSTIVEAKAIPNNIELSPVENNEPVEGKSKITTDIIVEKLIASSNNELSFENNGEVVTIGKNGGSTMTTTLGSYAPLLATNIETLPEESDEDKALTTAIIPPTGSTNNNVLYAIIGVISLAVLGAGTYGVRRFLKK